MNNKRLMKISKKFVGITFAFLFVMMGVYFSPQVKAVDVSGDIISDTIWDNDKTVIDHVTVKPGVTLTIDPGINVEFDLNKNLYVEGTLNAVGTQASQITFTSSDPTPQNGDWGTIYFRAFSTGKIQNATIEYGWTGITCFMASPTVRDCLIQNNKIYGLECRNYSFPNIINNVITDNGDSGIYLFNHSAALIQDNDILNAPLNYGIHVFSSSPIIEHNYIANNFLAGIHCTIGYNIGVSNATINNNTVTQNIINGMHFLNSHPRLYNNVIKYNGEDGIFISDSSSTIINQNTIQNNNHYGINAAAFFGYGRPIITNNNISYNNWSGVKCFGNSRAYIYNNEIKLNNGTGIKIEGSSATVEDNQINYNKEHGIHCDYSSRARIINNNIISANEIHGIHINNSMPTINDNKITYNKGSGIKLQSFSEATIHRNIIKNNDNDGISSNSNSKPYINGTIINDNGDYGVYCEASALDITNSEVKNNGNDGIYLFSTTVTRINDTDIDGNTGDGIYCESSSPLITLCNILNNQANAIFSHFYSCPTTINTTITNNNNFDFRASQNSHPVSLNNTFSKNNVNIDSTSSLTVQWFVNIKVTNSSAGLVPGALTSLKNIDSIEILNCSTNQYGIIYWTVANEYEEFTAVQRTMYTPHDLTINKYGYQPYRSQVTVDSTKWLEIVLNHVPAKPSNFSPLTTHSLTPELQWSPSIEEDLDPVTYHLDLYDGMGSTGTNLIDDAVTTAPSYQIGAPLSLEYGKSYFVELHADDGKGGISPTLEQVFYVVNNKPAAPTLEITPMDPKSTDDLVCNITENSTDEDSDPLDIIKYTYKWYKNGVLQNGYTLENSTSLSAELPSSATAKHELWKCEVTPWDGIEHGITARALIVVQNSAPEVKNPLEDFAIDEDSEDSTTINLYTVFEDADNDPLLFRAERVVESGGYNIKVEIDQSTGNVFLKPIPNWHGKEIIVFYATDTDTAEAYNGVELTVVSINDPPILNHTEAQTVCEYDWIDINLCAYDYIDPEDELTYSNNALDIIPGLKKDKNYFFDKKTGELSIETDSDMIGNYTIIVGVSDGNPNGNVSEQVEITVLNKNDPPSVVITYPNSGFELNTTTTIDLKGMADDPDLDVTTANESLEYLWKSNRSGILGRELNLNNILLPKGTHRISLVVSDREGMEVKAEIIVTVKSVGDGGGGGIGPGNGDPSGPTDSDDNASETGDDEQSNWILNVILVIIIIILALILSLSVLKLNKTRKESEAPEIKPDQEPEPRGPLPSEPEPEPPAGGTLTPTPLPRQLPRAPTPAQQPVEIVALSQPITVENEQPEQPGSPSPPQSPPSPQPQQPPAPEQTLILPENTPPEQSLPPPPPPPPTEPPPPPQAMAQPVFAKPVEKVEQKPETSETSDESDPE